MGALVLDLPHPNGRVMVAAAERKPTALRPARVLVVEDDYLVALELEEQLSEAGFEIVGIARSAAEATALAQKTLPEIAIMDVRILGAVDGVETAIQLRTRFDIPSIFATAHLDDETKARAHPARPVGWLSKPYSIPMLIGLLNQVLVSGGTA